MVKRIVIFTLALLMTIAVSACSRDSKDAGEGEKAFGQEVQDSTSADKEAADSTVETNTVTETTASIETTAVTGTTASSETTASIETTAVTGTTASSETTAGTETTAVTGTTASIETTTVSNNDSDSGYTASQPSSIDGNAEDGTKNSAETIPLDTRNDPDNESGILKGRIICIDPGHQSHGNYDTEPVAPGSDKMKAKVSSGTAGVKTRIPEYKLNLEVSLKLRDALEKYGATVIMTRTENDVDISNAERAAIANEANADLYFRIHADGSTDKSIKGVSVLIPGKGHITDKYILEESEKAGSCILKGFVEATGAVDRGMPKRNDLSGFNWCKVPMALIEMGFMSNPKEDEKLNTSEYQDKMVTGMADGIIEYFQQK